MIDLERGELLEEVFKLPHEFVVPDLLFERELKGALGDRLVALGLRIEELTPNEVAQATAIGRKRATLSTPDTFAYALAKERVWTLLTGDGALRMLANADGITAHGVLWIIDELHAAATLEKARLRAGLAAIYAHPRCRLPKVEVTTRLAMLEE